MQLLLGEQTVWVYRGQVTFIWELHALRLMKYDEQAVDDHLDAVEKKVLRMEAAKKKISRKQYLSMLVATLPKLGNPMTR